MKAVALLLALPLLSALSEDAATLIASAEALHVVGNVEAAIEKLRVAAQSDARATMASFELGNILFAPLQAAAESGEAVRRDDPAAREAEAAFRAALPDVTPSATSTPSPLKAPTGMVYNNLANLLSLLGSYDEAEELLRAGLRIDPVAYQYNGLANLLLRKATTAVQSTHTESGASGVPSRSSQANEEEEDDDDDWFVDETVPPPPAAPASPAVNATHAALEEAVALLHQAVAHEHAISAAAASSKGECGSSGSGGGAPPMEHAYRENLAHVLLLLGRNADASVQAEHARALAAAREADGAPAKEREHAQTERDRDRIGRTKQNGSRKKDGNGSGGGSGGSNDGGGASASSSGRGSSRGASRGEGKAAGADQPASRGKPTTAKAASSASLKKGGGAPPLSRAPPWPDNWQQGRPLVLMRVPSLDSTQCLSQDAPRGGISTASWGVSLEASADTASGADLIHACGCPPPFGALHDVAASAAALQDMGYAVEVCACAPVSELGLDANGTLWTAMSACELHEASRGRHIVVHVDRADTSIDARATSVTSSWLWQRGASAGVTSAALQAKSGSGAPLFSGVFATPTVDEMLSSIDGARASLPASSHDATSDALHIAAVPVLLDRAFADATASAMTPRPSSRFCYTQPPSVGLAALLQIWPQIRKARAKATLLVFSCAGRQQMDKSCAAAHKAAASATSGVRIVEDELMGAALAAALAGCAFDLIPVERPEYVEHGSLLRAQAAGAIPLSTRHRASCLPLACGKWDLGPPPCNESITASTAVRRDWMSSVLAVGSSRKLKEHRTQMQAWAVRHLAEQDATAVWHAAFQGGMATHSGHGVDVAPRRRPRDDHVQPPTQRPPSTSRPEPPAPTRISPPPAPPTQVVSSSAVEDDLPALERELEAEKEALRSLQARVALLEQRLMACKERKRGGGAQAAGNAGIADGDETADEATRSLSVDEGDDNDNVVMATAEGEATAPAAPRLCWIALLDRPGGVEVVLHAAKQQTSRDFRLVLLDRLHKERRASVQTALTTAHIGASGHAHLLAPAPRAAWSMRSIWQLARSTCEAGGSLEVVALVRQYVWLPKAFVASSLHFHSAVQLSASSPKLLTYPSWQFRAPDGELGAFATEEADEHAANTGFSPPLTTPFSSRGWRMVKRLSPSQDAALPGLDATDLAEDARALPPGAWSLSASEVASLDELVPAAPGPEVDRCFGRKRTGGKRQSGGAAKADRGDGLLRGSNLRAVLANLSLVCEALETRGWEPQSRWKYDAAIDGGAGCEQDANR